MRQGMFGVAGEDNSTLATLIKDLGKKCFGFTKMDAGEIAGIKARILKSLTGSRRQSLQFLW